MSSAESEVLDGRYPSSPFWWLIFAGSVIGSVLILGVVAQGVVPVLVWGAALLFLEALPLQLPAVSALAAAGAALAGAGWWVLVLFPAGFFLLSGVQMLGEARLVNRAGQYEGTGLLGRFSKQLMERSNDRSLLRLVGASMASMSMYPLVLMSKLAIVAICVLLQVA